MTTKRQGFRDSKERKEERGIFLPSLSRLCLKRAALPLSSGRAEMACRLLLLLRR
jgi:hypothetical protein